MWGNFMDLAEKAKRAAEQLDSQLNESVGIEQAPRDVWEEDDELFDSGPEPIVPVEEVVEEEEKMTEESLNDDKGGDDQVVEKPPFEPPAVAEPSPPEPPSDTNAEPSVEPLTEPEAPNEDDLPVQEASEGNEMDMNETGDDSPQQMESQSATPENETVTEPVNDTTVPVEPEPEHIKEKAPELAAEQFFTPQQSSKTANGAADEPQQTPLDTQHIPPTHDQATDEYTKLLEAQLEQLQQSLTQREEQLFSKTEQLTNLQNMYDTDKADLQQKLQHTKEEAKKRIQKAKERVEAMELKLADESQTEIILALREEGEKLARKQADMEASVRTAKGESRELKQELESTTQELETATERVATLEADLKSTREELSLARQGESQAGKLDNELRTVREESEQRASKILGLEATVKELKKVQKELNKELESTKMGAANSSEQERKRLRKEHNEMITDLEKKIRKTEQEAEIREEGLRKEVDELRKRWQDAVRRADALSVDVQSSTAPLLRQLESTNKQNRARAAAWAELETQLRSELEENVIQNERLSKERTDWKTKATRLERSTTELETELKQVKNELYETSDQLKKLQIEMEEIKEENKKKRAEWAEVERLANEGVSRVRSEMTRTVVDAEERHKNQLENLESQLREQSSKRAELEKQVEKLLANEGVRAALVPLTEATPLKRDPEPKELRESEGQIQILAGALGDLGDADDEDSEDNHLEHTNGRSGSFAAIEQISSRLKAAKVELETLRKRYEESERTREEMVELLAESRNAREKLPLFEAKVKELTIENKELSQEVEGLRGDIIDVQDLYRSQLNVLLEAQSTSNGGNSAKSDEAPVANGGKDDSDE